MTIKYSESRYSEGYAKGLTVAGVGKRLASDSLTRPKTLLLTFIPNCVLINPPVVNWPRFMLASLLEKLKIQIVGRKFHG